MPARGHSPSFSWNAADYHTSSQAQQQWAQELIAKLALRGSEHVLDRGCGDGKVTAAIAESVPYGAVVGVDSSPEMIQFARGHFSDNQHPNLLFIEMAAEALQFFEEFDVIFSSAALHWVNNHRPVLSGIARSLRPGRRILIQMGGKGNADQVFRALNVLLGNQCWRQYFKGFSFAFGFFGIEEYRKWLSDTGLASVLVELIPKDIVFRTRQDFGSWIRTTWLPYLHRIPEDLHTAFIEALIDQYLSMFRQIPTGQFTLAWSGWKSRQKRQDESYCMLRNL
jgi:trans-aconitate methyltransferase